MDTNKKSETYYLSWLNPRDKKLRDAGVAFYNKEYGEYLLKVDEDEGKQYYLKAISTSEGKTNYRMEMVLKRSNGSFLRRQCIGDGYSSILTDGNVHIQYGSKYATLVLFLKK
jgi:hypothetical protein